MTAAGLAASSSGGASVPHEAREVVRLCKLLPLTLGALHPVTHNNMS